MPNVLPAAISPPAPARGAASRWGALRHPDFRLFWLARTIGFAGDRVGQLALPSAAILALKAAPAQVGLLNALSFIAYPILALLAGVWVDRVRRRRVLVTTDIVRFFLMASIPGSAILGHLTLAQLYVVAAAVGAMTVFFDLASTAYVPAIVPQADWASANSQMEAAQQTIAAGGPGLAGLLISAISAPTTLLVNAVTFLASAILVFPTREPPLERIGLRRNALAEALEGLHYLLAHAGLLRITLTAAISNVGLMMVMAVNLLFLYRVLALPAFVVGLSFAAGSLASVIGALFNQRIVLRIGVHGALLLSTLVEGLGWLLVPLSLFGLAIPVVIAGMVVSGFFNTTWNVGVVTYRQRNVPLKLMGRVGAGSRMIGYGALPLGSLLGGLLGQALVGSLGQRNGLALTLVIGAAVAASSAVGLLGWRAFDRQPAPATSV